MAKFLQLNVTWVIQVALAACALDLWQGHHWIQLYQAENGYAALAHIGGYTGALYINTYVLISAMSLAELLIHRYPMHRVVPIPVLGKLFENALSSHGGTHHPRNTPADDEPGEVNRYPITRIGQALSATFPLYFIILLWGLFLPAALFVQWIVGLIVPGMAWLVLWVFMFATACYYRQYERDHLIMHLPRDMFWDKVLSNPNANKCYREMDEHHKIHHEIEMTNHGVVYFKMLGPLNYWADRACGTYLRAKKRPMKLAEVRAQFSARPAPHFTWKTPLGGLIAWLDERCPEPEFVVVNE